MLLPQLNYHHLRLFLAVARSGSLRGAAVHLHLSLPTISTSIKALEVALGKKLFDRCGRGLKLSVVGKKVMECASEIFAIGTEMIQSLEVAEKAQVLRLRIGITDSLPKLVVWGLIRPAVEAVPHLHLTCVEGRTEDLLGKLASGRLDAVLADESASASLPVKIFNHRLGESSVQFCAVPAMAQRLARGFPKSLERAPALLPASRTAWRHGIDRWFDSVRIHPEVVGEFDDAALMKTVAAAGVGYVPIASVVLSEAVERYGLRAIGRPVECGFGCYMITVAQSLRHPALEVIAVNSKKVFRQ